MAAELHRTDQPTRGALRILRGQIDEARSTLTARRPSDKAIHQARKSIKRARATLRLVRDAVPEAVFDRENRALRDIARSLSAARDSAVMLETLNRLEKLYGSVAREGTPLAVRRVLKREMTRTGRQVGEGRHGNTLPAASALKQAGSRLARVRITEEEWRPVGTAVKRVYRSGRRAMKQAKRTPSPECLHEWRKQSKHLWHALQVLQPLEPGTLGELADQAHHLSDYLGDDHDLAVLRDKAEKLKHLFARVGGAGVLLALIDRCRSQLQEKAFRVGERIYDERPVDFRKHMDRYWKQACAREPNERRRARLNGS